MVTKCLQLTLIVWPRFKVEYHEIVSSASLKQANRSLIYAIPPSTSSAFGITIPVSATRVCAVASCHSSAPESHFIKLVSVCI